MQPTAILTERTWNASWLASAWRFVAVLALLLTLNCIVADGGLSVFRQIRPSGRFLLYFSLGWPGVEWALLAFWLTWGPGSFVGRLILTLSLIAVRSAMSLLWSPYSLEDGVFFVWSLIFSYTIVLGAHGLMLPIRDCTSWRIVGRVHKELIAQPLQWSIRQLLVWTTFVAIPLALSQLALRMLSIADPNPMFWTALCTETAIAGSATGAIGIALLAERLSWGRRLGIVAAAPLVTFSLRLGYVTLYDYPDGVPGSLWWSTGLSAAAVVNMLVLRWCGLRWKRALDPNPTLTLVQSPAAFVSASGDAGKGIANIRSCKLDT